MAKDDRLYGKFTQDFADNPKILPLSDAAFRCLVEATLYSRRMLTDGFLATRLATAKWSLAALDELATNDPLKPSFLAVDGGWMIHDYAEHQDTKAEVEARRSRNAANGSKGGIARAKRVASKSVSEIQAETETETETTTSNEVVKTPGAKAALDELFEVAWGHWPKKTKKAAALAKFKLAARSQDAEQLCDTITAFGDAYESATTVQFTPGLDVWLNGKRWDEPLPVASEDAHKATRGDKNLAYVQQLQRAKAQRGIES